jgi:hypothetical protein
MTNGRLTTLAAALVLTLASTDAFAVNGRAAGHRSLVSLEAMASDESAMSKIGKAVATAALALAVFNPSPALADGALFGSIAIYNCLLKFPRQTSHLVISYVSTIFQAN